MMNDDDGPGLVAENLWVGDILNAKNLNLLNRLKITHIINATAEEKMYYPDNFIYLRIPLYDRASERATPFFDQAIDFITSAHADGGLVMIHCAEGVSRSVTLALAYRMHKDDIPLSQAFWQMKSVRPEIEPNPGFLQELRELERVKWGHVVTKEKLTQYDYGFVELDSPLLQLRYRVETYCAGGSYHVGMRQVEVQRNAVLEVARNMELSELESALPSIIFKNFHDFGGNTRRDIEGRANLACILEDVSIINVGFANVIRNVVVTIGSSEEWKEFLVDHPRAPDMIQELKSVIAPGFQYDRYETEE